jgi:hypothetical protein
MSFVSKPGIATACFLAKGIAHFTAKHRSDLLSLVSDLEPSSLTAFTTFLDALQTGAVLVSHICDLWQLTRPD